MGTQVAPHQIQLIPVMSWPMVGMEPIDIELLFIIISLGAPNGTIEALAPGWQRSESELLAQ
jgi:hypothetical protein